MRRKVVRAVFAAVATAWLLCVVVAEGEGGNPGETGAVNAAKRFPQDDYTPFGYLRTTGDIVFWGLESRPCRSQDCCGFGWLDEIGKDGTLKVGLIVDGVPLVFPEHFQKTGIQRVSRHHTLNLISFDFSYQGTEARLEFVAPDADSIGCRATVIGAGKPVSLVVLSHMTRGSGFGYTEWHADPRGTALYSRRGPWFVTTSDVEADSWDLSKQDGRALVGRAISGTLSNPRERHQNHMGETGTFDHVSAIQRYDLGVLAPNSSTTRSFVMVRSTAPKQGEVQARKLAAELSRIVDARRADDDRFWANAPRLRGDWPPAWPRGFVYDMDTTQHILMPPMGIFRKPWPSWKTEAPRIVLAENCLDMMRLHYADPEAAQEALVTMFETAPEANIPCMCPNGSLNMIDREGRTCGTSPAWCLPFHSIYAMYLRQLDKEWLGRVYPYMCAYLDWWLEHRTDEEKWAVYACTWEAGEDANPRLDSEHAGDTVISDKVRPAELQAAFAQSALLLATIARELGRPENEAARWLAVYEDYRARTRSMWDEEWQVFRDWDKIANRWTTQQDGVTLANIRFSPLSLIILMYDVAAPEQAAVFKKQIPRYTDSIATEWASWSYAVVEGGLAAGEYEAVSTYANSILKRMYPLRDRREVGSVKGWPGQVWETWIPKDKGTGADLYGWGATTYQFLVRAIMGFRESPDTSRNDFVLCPALPADFLKEGAVFAIDNLSYRGRRIFLDYVVSDENTLRATVQVSDAKNLRVTSDTGTPIPVDSLGKGVAAALRNYTLYRIEFD